MKRVVAKNAFTLIEMVLVLVILGMVASLVAVRYAAPLQKARVRSVAEYWQGIEHNVRYLNRVSPIRITIQNKGSSTEFTIRRDDDELIRRWAVDPPVSVSVTDKIGNKLDSIAYSIGQGSIDYKITFQDGSMSRSLTFAGGTGCVLINE
ncbi:MAG: pilus assembly FimT family protein [Pirellula sp.]|jgi:prepilin-type N-terminal cleavage/methylation domain-containing protein